MKLVDKRIVITGGTSGIGLALVEQLSLNNDVIVISRSQDLPNKLIQGESPVLTFKADLSERVQLEKAAETIRHRYEYIDVLINNAAIQNTPEFLSDNFDYRSIQREIDLNFSSVCHLTSLLLPLLRKESPSVILNINSGLALSPKRSSAIYCATKGALNIFSQSLDYQLNETNISIQQAFLPLVDTQMTKGRGKSKLNPSYVASQILRGITKNLKVNDIGKVKFLRLIARLSPNLAGHIMRNS